MSSNQTSTRQSAVTSTETWLRRLVIALTILAWIALAAVAFWIVGKVVQALLLLIVGALIAYVIYPLVKILDRFMPRILAVILVYVLVLVGIAILFYFVGSVFVAQGTSFIFFVRDLINSKGTTNSQLQPIIETLNRLGVSNEQLRSYGQQLLGQLQNVVTNVFNIVTNVFSLLLNTFLTVMLSVYFLFSGPKTINWFRNKMPSSLQAATHFLLDTLQKVVGGYVRGTVTLALVFSILTGVGVALIGVPYAFLLAVLSFVLEFVPFLGVYITGVAIVLVALTQGWVTALLALVLFIILQNLENNVLSPRIVGGAVGINPIINIFAVIAGANLFGIAGAFFAAPIAGFIQSLLIALWTNWKNNHPDQFPGDQGNQPDKQKPDNQAVKSVG